MPAILTTTAESIRAKLIVAPEPFMTLRVANDAPQRTPLNIAIAGRVISADISTEALRRVVLALAAFGGTEHVLVLQGNLVGDRLEVADLIAQPKLRAVATLPEHQTAERAMTRTKLHHLSSGVDPRSSASSASSWFTL